MKTTANHIIRYIKSNSIIIILFMMHMAVTLFFLFYSYHVVNVVRPLPTSDFKYYWDLASDLSIYHKGGIIGFIYAPFKQLGLEPYWAALMVNGFFFVLTSIATWLSFNKNKHAKHLISQFLMTLGLAMFGFWNAAYAGMVNADFPNVALLIISTRAYSIYGTKMSNKWGLIIGGIGIYLAVALRVKTGLALGIIVSILVLVNFKTIIQKNKLRLFIITVCIAVGFAAVTEITLRHQSLRQEDVARQGRLQLYTGILHTSKGPMVGRWTKEAYDKTLEELDLSMTEVLHKHLSVKSKTYLMSLVGEKWLTVLRYDDFAYRELLAFGVRHRQYTPEDLEIVKPNEILEEQLVECFKILVYLSILFTLIFNKSKVRIIPFAIYFAFFLLHGIFEIQARYMVEPLMWSYFSAIFINFEISSKQVMGHNE